MGRLNELTGAIQASHIERQRKGLPAGVRSTSCGLKPAHRRLRWDRNTITARHVLRIGLHSLAARPAHIVQTAATSAVGKIVTALALREGFHPVRLVRSPASAARLASSLPGGEIIDTETAGWQDRIRRTTRGDIPLVLDGVGGPMVAEIGRLLNTKGTVVSFGLLDGGPADLTMFLPKGLSLRAATIGTWRDDTEAKDREQDIAATIEIARTVPQVFADFHAFDLADLNTAVTAATAPGKTGNIVIKF
jgi:NADPH:quinone reductase